MREVCGMLLPSVNLGFGIPSPHTGLRRVYCSVDDLLHWPYTQQFASILNYFFYQPLMAKKLNRSKQPTVKQFRLFTIWMLIVGGSLICLYGRFCNWSSLKVGKITRLLCV